jgi:hypothetical protein
LHTSEEIQAVIDRYPRSQQYALAAMQDMQRQFGYLPREGLEALSKHLSCPFSQLYSMATFYKAFSLKRKAKTSSSLRRDRLPYTAAAHVCKGCRARAPLSRHPAGETH